MLLRWIRDNTVIPVWIPKGWRQVWLIHALMVIVQALAILITAGLLQLLPDFGFKGALFILGATVVSHYLGTFPGMLASLVGTTLFDLFLVPPFFTIIPGKAADVLDLLFYLLVCITISVLVKRSKSSEGIPSEK